MRYYQSLVLSGLISLIHLTCVAQRTQFFTEKFKTSSGIYGYVQVSTTPSTVGSAYILINQQAVVVEGIQTQGINFTGSDLNSQGVSFPFSCNNCFFYADGEAKMNLNGTAYYGKFNKGGTINYRGGTNQSVNFSQAAKELHNAIREETGTGNWEATGSINYINISSVKGADLGKITSAVNDYFTEIEEKEKQIAREKERAEREEKERAAAELKKRKKETLNKATEIEKEQKKTNKKGYSSRQAATDSYNNGMDTAQKMRDEANSMIVRYKFEQDYKEELLRRADELERNLINPNQAIIGDSSNTTEYQQRSNSANEQLRNQQIAAGAASAVTLVMILGGAIYKDYGYTDGLIYKEGVNNLHLGLDFGFSTSTSPIYFPKIINERDEATDQETTFELLKPRETLTLNLGGKLKFGAEGKNYSAEAYGGFRGGISAVLKGTHTLIFYGSKVKLGTKNIKVIGGYERGHRSNTFNDWLKDEDDGKGSSNITYRNFRAGIEVSWYGNETKYGRNHLSLGLIQENVVNLKDGQGIEFLPEGDTTINGETFNAQGQAGFFIPGSLIDEANEFDEYTFTGAFLEWRHDHHGTLLIEFFPSYPHTGEVSELFDFNDWPKKGNSLATISFTRNLDWFFQKRK